jgi:hypothetical protein
MHGCQGYQLQCLSVAGKQDRGRDLFTFLKI